MKINFRKRVEEESFDLAKTLKNLCPNEVKVLDAEKFTEKKDIKVRFYERKEKFSFSQYKKAA